MKTYMPHEKTDFLSLSLIIKLWVHLIYTVIKTIIGKYEIKDIIRM